MVGNGQFVKDFKEGLLQGGVAEECCTTEIYFNGKVCASFGLSRASVLLWHRLASLRWQAEPSPEVAAYVADAIRGLGA